MCNVHLVETSRTTRPVNGAAGWACGHCGEPVRGEAVFIEGHLDDGSPGCYRFIYHPNCTWDMEHDLEEIDRNEGCFSDGSAIEVIDATAGMEATVASGEHPGLDGAVDVPGMIPDPCSLGPSELPSYVRERWPVAVERAARKTRAALPNPAVGPLLQAARNGSTVSQRVVWLQRAASAWAQPLQGVAACRRGCAHCCHIPVTISAIEAALIGRHIGRAPERPDLAVRLDAFADLSDAVAALQTMSAEVAPSPCPFLREGACSIYEARPMACRLLLNLDDDDLLCQRVPGQEIPVPYADATQLKALFLLAQPATPLADIRAFFAKTPDPLPAGLHPKPSNST